MSPLRPEDRIDVTPHGDASTNGVAVVVHLTEKPESKAALSWALAHSQTFAVEPGQQAAVHVVLSGGDGGAASTFFSPTTMTEVEDGLRAARVPHQIHRPTDDPVGQVLQLVENLDAAAVVTGVVRRSATMKLLLGSHTQQLLLQAPCPVVAVKAKDR